MNDYLNEKYKETERLLKEYIRLKADAKQARQEEDESSEAAQKKKSAKNQLKRACEDLLTACGIAEAPVRCSGVLDETVRETLRDYFIRFLSHALVTTFVCYLSVWACSLVGYSLLSVIPRLLICAVLPNAVLFLLFFWTKEFKYFGRLGRELLAKVRGHDGE